MNTTPENKIAILSDLWINYRSEEAFADLFEYADLAFPLAYAIENEIVKNSDKATPFIDETFELLLSSSDIEEDTGFESLDEIFESMI
jgi:hypothetical protein